MQKGQHPFVQYDAGFSQMGQTPRTPNYRPPPNVVMSTFCAMGSNQPSGDAAYMMQWPSAVMMYAQSYEPFRQAVYQVEHSP